MTLQSEFSRIVPIAHVDHGDVVQKIEADEFEREAVRIRLHLEGLSSLVGDFVVRRDDHVSLYRVEGEIYAKVTQICVTSSEAFDSDVRATIRALYSDAAGLAIDYGQSDDESWDDVEPIVDNEIDIGELAVQHVSLALDPYPRKPGLELAGDYSDEKPHSPFALLKGLVGRD